ncbi:acyl carrier protein [Facklamia sp. DSM 111018]|uniref:Acyl carrier protein n=1 Tax=Facklamia lactis TaxID=2749967 RepID=A0ABS0LMY7_9LACT|nr:acyl carrier protein [Facklamia lactis]MBG9979807.1 acyl carrier protein [Facklamia lactis]MBG9985513.1 acyl carrier protein [Facklamia lactis]
MSNKQEIFENVKTLIVDRFGVAEDSVTEEMTFEDLGADSLDIVEFVMELEDQYSIEFEDEKIEKLNNIKDAVDYIDQLKNNQ